MPRKSKADRKAVVEHYRETGSTAATAAVFGISQQTVANYCKALDVPIGARGGRRRYQLDEGFFETYSRESCYWAGFLAADGSLVKRGTAHCVQVMLARADREHLSAFLRCAGSTHPVKDVTPGGNPESSICISSKRWWDGLVERFLVTPRKSFTLQPPDGLVPPEMVSHFLRGYFDGDGGVEQAVDGAGRPKQISFYGGSRPFIEWVRRELGSHHKIMPNARIWRFFLSGEVMRQAIPLLYAGSTPDTRLARKYERLKRWL